MTFPIPDQLLLKVFAEMKSALNKHELRYLMKKFRFPEDKIQELEATYHGKDQLEDRVFHAMMYWREFHGSQATLDELIRILHIVHMDELSEKIKSIKVLSQAMRL